MKKCGIANFFRIFANGSVKRFCKRASCTDLSDCKNLNIVAMNLTQRILILVSLLTIVLPGRAQDIIVRCDGSVVQAKILEVSSSEIKYKRYSNPDGPLFTLKSSEILSINYENGEVDRYNTSEKETTSAPSAATPAEPRLLVAEADADNSTLLERYNSTRLPIKVGKPTSKSMNNHIYKLAFAKNSVLSSVDAEIIFEHTSRVYPFIGSRSEYDIKIRNKTDQTLYFDLARCYRIMPDGSSHAYYDGSKQTSITHAGSTGIGINLGHGISIGGGGASATTTTYTNERILMIPPRSVAYLSTHKMVKNQVLSTGESLWRGEVRYRIPGQVYKGVLYNYSEEDTLGFIRYTLTYSNSPDFITSREQTINLYIQQVVGVDEFKASLVCPEIHKMNEPLCQCIAIFTAY